MSNQIHYTAIVLSVDEEGNTLLCRAGKNKEPLSVRCDETVSLAHILPGQKIDITGRLASCDISHYFSCDCHTVNRGIESYLYATQVVTTTDAKNRNEVELEGIIVSLPKKITTNQTIFYTLRLKLLDGSGYISCSVTEELQEKLNLRIGDEIRIAGYLKAKDYKKHCECPICHLVYKQPVLSLLVAANTAEKCSATLV